MESIVGKFAKDLSTFAFNTIKLGHEFETKGILSGVDSTPLVWRLIETHFTKNTYIFKVSYHGIFVGEFSVHPSDNYKVVPL